MDSIIKDDNFTPDEKVAATIKATNVMIEYMGAAKAQNERIDVGLNYLIKTHKYLKGMIILLILVVGGLYYVARKMSNQNAVDRADIGKARDQIIEIQKNSIKKDSLFNQKKVIKVETVNAEKVEVVNTNTVNIKKK